jgi:hypothetical protein
VRRTEVSRVAGQPAKDGMQQGIDGDHNPVMIGGITAKDSAGEVDEL